MRRLPARAAEPPDGGFFGKSGRFFRLALFGRRKMGNFGFPCRLADITTHARPTGPVPFPVCKVKRRCRLAMKSLTR